MRLSKRLVGVLLLSPPLFAFAALPYAPSDAEVAQLPNFCAIKFKRPGPNFESHFGRKNWVHMHHYCHGLKFVNRARNHPKDRREYLGRAKGEYAYVFRTTEPDFWFRPQMYVEVARIHLQLGERTDAQKRLMEAIRLNPRYEPAYVALIALQKEDGAHGATLELATQGVRYLPTSEALKKAYLDSGGKLPLPDPITTTRATSTSERPLTAPENAEQAPSEPSASTMNQDEAAAPQGAEGERMTGCRFCPPEEIQQRWRESFQGEE